MRTTSRAGSALLILGLGLMTAACGSADKVKAADPSATSSAAPAASLLDRPWLLRLNVAGGNDGEQVTAMYVHFTPGTGAVTIRRLPGVVERDTSGDAQAVLVSADQKYALLDAGVTRADKARGRLTLYPTSAGKVVHVDLRALTQVKNLRPVGAAFDPTKGEVLRVVDATRHVWVVDPVAGTASRAGVLERREGWIFANGFDKNTGLPYIEDINSSRTLPAGNGDDDVRPVQRQGGEIVTIDGTDTVEDPAVPCGFGSGFDTADGTRWMFCADTPRLTTYRLSKGATKWEQVGAPSKDFIPATAGELPVVLPPV